MTKQQAKFRIEKLKKVINYHRYLYHVLDKQEISPEAIDSLKKELFDLEQRFQDLITFDSPTQRVSGKPLKKFEKVRHIEPMLSLNDAFSEKDVQDWLDRNKKLLIDREIEQIDFYCELKLDGVAIELIYENGLLKTGSTRGNGIIGEDVTQNLKTIEAIPLKLRTPRHFLKNSAGLTVRGEIFINKKDFQRINKEQEKNDLPAYANPRNLAAGSIRQLDPKITDSRNLDSFAYDLRADPTLLSQKRGTHQERHKILKTLGFKTNPYNQYCHGLNEVFAYFEKMKKIREKLDYEIDGIVININSNKIFEKLDVVGKAPRGAIALKFPLKQATTVVKDIKIQVGRTGALTPVAILKPVDIGGTTVSRATLHNEDEIRRLDLKIGDTVIIGRAGDVIPDIIKILPELRTGKEKKFEMLKICPSCGHKIIKPGIEVISRCVNSNCFAQKTRQIYHFISKSAFDIVGLGPKVIDQLLDQGLIQDAADLFDLKKGDLIFLEGFQKKASQNLIQAIKNSKQIDLPRFIYALGIRGVGEETSYDLAEYFGNIENLENASVEQLENIRDIGPKTAQSIYNWFKNKTNLAFLEKLKKQGIEIKSSKFLPAGTQVKASSFRFQGKIFVLTGTLESMTRDEAKQKIRNLGGEISESVSKQTDYLIIGQSPGFKFSQAQKFGVKQISEQKFLEML